MLKRQPFPEDEAVQVTEIMPHLTKPTLKSHGEYDMPSEEVKSEDIVERLVEHIRILADIGSHLHEQNNFTINDKKQLELKKDALNNITRVNQYEFSMYPKNPLTLDQFLALREKVAVMASKYPINLHLVLSSFPVVIQNQVQNCVIYLQCGKNPILTTIAKKNPSTIDVFREKSTPLARAKPLNKFELAKNDISYNPIIEFKTAGNIPVVSVLEICNDHRHGHGKKALIKRIKNRELKEMKRTRPLLGTHIITSNSVEVDYKNALTSEVVYVDPVGSKIKNSANSFLDKNYLTGKAKLKTKQWHSGKTSISFLPTHIEVENPPFGNKYSLYVLEKYTVSSFSHPDIKESVNELYDHERFIELKKTYLNVKEAYKKMPGIGKKRKAVIAMLDKKMSDFYKNDAKINNRTLIMLGFILLAAQQAQDSHASQFFKKNKNSRLSEALTDLVKLFTALEKMHISEEELRKEAKRYLEKKPR